MTLDEVNLELLAKCGNARDKAHAAKIIPIRKDGYFLLVSLLLANTVTAQFCPNVDLVFLLDNQRNPSNYC